MPLIISSSLTRTNNGCEVKYMDVIGFSNCCDCKIMSLLGKAPLLYLTI